MLLSPLKFFKLFIFSLLFFAGFLTLPAIASEKNNLDAYTYVFHLWQTPDALTTDRDFDFPFDLIAKECQPFSAPQNSYSVRILSIKNQLLTTVYFYSSMLASKNSGKLSVEAPYFPNAKTAVFFDTLGKELLTLDLAPGGPVCNEDGTCNSNFGEDNQNCPTDCLKATTTEPEITLPAEKSIFKPILIILISVLGLLVIAIGGWLIIRRRTA